MFAAACRGEDDQLSDLRKEVETLRQRVFDRGIAETKQVDAWANRAGRLDLPNNPVSTKSGRLTVGGLLQIWAYSIQNDNAGLNDLDQIALQPATGGGISNETADNDSFRIRRAELKFALDLTENISSVVMLDFAREATSFPAFNSNQATDDSGAVYTLPCNCDTIFGADPRGLGTADGTINRLLQDAYINFHGYVPHHDFNVGQFRRRLGEEGSRSDADLDFIERAMITQLSELRDIGAQAHGSWLDNRVEYWLGVFNGSGPAFSARSNRSDDNDAKDVAFTIRGEPLRKHEDWGSLELGYSIMHGTGGEASSHTPGTNPINGLNQRETTHGLQYAWAAYHPGGPVKGWWLRGEWANYRDRFAPAQAASGLDITSSSPAPFNVSGWYFSTGYRLDQSVWCDSISPWLRPLEFTFRYDVMQNIFFHDLVVPERRFDVYKTQVFTAGLNYRLTRNIKFQVNYNWVDEEDKVDRDDRQLREVQNNSLVLNFQTSF